VPVYAWQFVCEPGATKTWDVWVEGEAVTDFSLLFPPGPCGLLKVAVFYGLKKLYPYGEDQWFAGDNCEVRFSDELPLPESPCRLRIVAVNEDEAYPHAFFVWMRTRPPRPRVEVRVAEGGTVEIVI